MFNIFKKHKPKFTELFVRVRHEQFGEGFIVAYSDRYQPIGVRFDKYHSALGSICGDGIIRGYKTYGNSEWFYEEYLEEVKNYDYTALIEMMNNKTNIDIFNKLNNN